MNSIDTLRAQTVQLCRLAELRYRRQLSKIVRQKQDIVVHQKQLNIFYDRLAALRSDLQDIRNQLRLRNNLTAHELQMMMHSDSDCQSAIELCLEDTRKQELIVSEANNALQILHARLQEIKLRSDALHDELGKRMTSVSNLCAAKLAEQLEDDFAQSRYSSC